jgi:hypothetical protein
VEHDVHLQNMTDIEEWRHPFFRINLIQSILSVTNALYFLMSFMFSVELMINPPVDIESESDSDSEEEETKSVKPLELYFFPEHIWAKLKRKLKSIKCCGN